MCIRDRLCTVYSVLAGLVSGWLGGWLYFCLAGLVAGWLGDWLAVWLDDWSRATRKKEFYPAARGTLQLHVQTPVFRKKPRPLRRTVYKQADWQQHQPEKIPASAYPVHFRLGKDSILSCSMEHIASI